MDEAVALLIATPAITLALWSLAFFGNHAHSAARSAVAAERAAAAALAADGAAAARTAERVTQGSTWPACADVSSSLDHINPDEAFVSVICDVPGPVPNVKVCVVGYAQQRPASIGHTRTPCP